MIRTILAFLLVAVGCSGGDDQVEPCSPLGTVELDLIYRSGDCVDPGTVETVELEIMRIGMVYQADENGEPVDRAGWNEAACVFSVASSFHYDETPDTWEIEGTVNYDLDFSGVPSGTGEMNATIYTDTGETACRQEIEASSKQK